MQPAANDSKLNPQAIPTTPAKRRYETPAVKVHGDVKDLTGSGPARGVHDMALSSAPNFS